ncbi:hypothetical protein AMS68_006116 [Peltaster fructicola]|uniref:RNA-binding protein VTS1 n=1 Tax=Peltaster fructicola TaxID=286661 RepID=A0A6H0Y160_9PEZI|nr:hypothetical protein AMS68_006116 [Peltaster fructicola]
MSASNIIGNRNSTPETSSSLRPPSSRTLIGTGHHLRASADMGALSGSASTLAARGIRPASEVYLSQLHQGAAAGNPDDIAEKVAQQWMSDIEQNETTLEDMASATLDQDFKDELSAIEQWFRVLSEPERTAALYALLQQTTQIQIRFFIQVLQQMAKSHPMSGVLSPAAFNEKDPMSSRLSDAMGKLNVEGSRSSLGFVGSKPPPSPGAKRMSGLDPSTIKSMFPDAANAIEDQKAEFQKTTGTAPISNRNSAVGDRSSAFMAPGLSSTLDDDNNNTRKSGSGIPAGPWRNTNPTTAENSLPSSRPKSSTSTQQSAMGQFGLGNPSAGLRSPRPFPLASDSNIHNQTAHAADSIASGMPILSPYVGGSWASAMNTPMVSNFNTAQNAGQADLIANATAMKLAALSTVNNRIQLDDVRKYRRARSTEGQNGQGPMTPANIMMTNEYGQTLSQQQILALQQQQQAAAMAAGHRSRPNSPGIAITGPLSGAPPGMALPMAQHNGFLTAFDGSIIGMNNGLAGTNLNNFSLGSMGGEGYLSDASDINRGRSPRGHRGSSKPPEDPTDLALLKDIPAWLRTLRLHKYTDQLKDTKWQELVQLDDEGLEKMGVNALGARRKLLKVFEQVREAQAEGKL